MNKSNALKTLLASLATVAVVGTAFAQGPTANTAIKNAPTGAGQQSTQNTPMGTTGTPGGSTAMPSNMNSGSTSSASGSAAPMATTGSSTSAPVTTDNNNATSTAAAPSRPTTRPMRADRN